MKLTYLISFMLGVSIWFNIQSYIQNVDRKVKAAYENGYQRGKLDQSWNELAERIKNRIDRMKEDLSQTPGK